MENDGTMFETIEFYLKDDIGRLSMFLLDRTAISCSCAGYCSIW